MSEPKTLRRTAWAECVQVFNRLASQSGLEPERRERERERERGRERGREREREREKERQRQREREKGTTRISFAFQIPPI